MSKSKPWERLDKEGSRPYGYFLWFRDNGKNGRSIDQCAEHFDKSPRTFYQYSRRFKWLERAQAWDDRLVEEQDKVILSAVEKLAHEHLKSLGLMRALGNTTLARTLQKAQTTKTAPTTVREANALVRDAVTLERLVTEQATDRIEGRIDVSKMEPGKAEQLLELLAEAGVTV